MMACKTSHKLTYLYLFMSLAIFSLHGVVIDRYESSLILETFNKIFRIICNSAVPTFFFLSATLFYRSPKENYCKLIKKKFQTLVIPYFCWSIILFVFRNTLKKRLLQPLDTVKNIVLAESNPVLWFVRITFSFFVIYPVIEWLLKYKTAYLTILIAFITLNIIIGPEVGYSTMMYWLPIYMFGAYIGFYHHDKFFSPHFTNLKGRLFALAAFVLLVCLAYFNNYLLYVLRMLAPICIWAIADVFAVDRKPNFWMTQSFFLYCAQCLVTSIASKIYIKILGTGTLSAVLAHFIIPFIMLAIIQVFMYILHEFIPKLYKILSGGR